MSMRNLLLCALIALSSVAMPASAQINISIGAAPPPVRYEAVPAPRSGYVWAPGYWRWQDPRHVWTNGRWIEARPGHYWVADRWEPKDGHHHYKAGHWAWDNDDNGKSKGNGKGNSKGKGWAKGHDR
jgi:hypothetical protein